MLHAKSGAACLAAFIFVIQLASGAAGDKQTLFQRIHTIAFYTIELYPVTPWGGGAGVVINGLVLELLEHGYTVVVVADLPMEVLINWETSVKDKLGSSAEDGKLVILQQFSLIGMLGSMYSPVPHLRNARATAEVVRLAYQSHPFGIVEIFDYSGRAFELLRAKRGGSDQYLPVEVTIAVRFHGPLHFIDRAENREDSSTISSGLTTRGHMYLLEHYSALAADMLLCQSESMREVLAEFYRVSLDEILYAPVPMETILKDIHPSNISHSDNRQFLIYGRMQLVKGLEAIVQAGIAYLQKIDSDRRVHFLFVGPDVPSKINGLSTSSYLLNMIPENLRSHFTFSTASISRAQLTQISAQSFAAIFASSFESLNLAVHELNYLGLPLLLSRIPVFEEHFMETAMFFDAGNHLQLEKCIDRIVKWPISSHVGMKRYPNSLHVYKLQPRNGQNFLRHSLNILERDILSIEKSA